MLLIDVDSKIANSALMKISALYKRKGAEVELRKVRRRSIGLPHPRPDKVFVSCVFSKNRQTALKIAKMFPNSKVSVGGYGVNDAKLPDEIEHCMPDYSLYGIDYSIGFTSRGCIRRCPWCIIPEKEGWIRDHAPITEFLHESHDKVVLLDNNLLAAPSWEKTLQFLIDHVIKVNFSQGLDIRLVNEENAAMLADTKFYNLHFKRPYIYFAFDLPSMEKEVRRGVGVLNNAGIKSTYLVFYMLTNFNTKFEEDRHRFEVLRELGVTPFVMLYNKENASQKAKDFQRYGTRPAIWRNTPWEEYDRLLTFRKWRQKQG